MLGISNEAIHFAMWPLEVMIYYNTSTSENVARKKILKRDTPGQDKLFAMI